MISDPEQLFKTLDFPFFNIDSPVEIFSLDNPDGFVIISLIVDK